MSTAASPGARVERGAQGDDGLAPVVELLLEALGGADVEVVAESALFRASVGTASSTRRAKSSTRRLASFSGV